MRVKGAQSLIASQLQSAFTLERIDEMKLTSIQAVAAIVVGVGPNAVAAWGNVGHETIGFVLHLLTFTVRSVSG